ncbi:MAG: glycosyltransferase family 39 protein [Planctomycetia bacterium]
MDANAATTSHDHDARPRWLSKGRGWTLSLVLACLGTLPFFVHGWFESNDETNDAAMYVACARSILAGEGYSYLEAPFTIRPPGTSWLAAAIMAWRGEDWLAINIATSLFGVLGVVLLHLHAATRLPRWFAWLLALGVWFSSPYQELCNQVMSDIPGAALVLACLALERLAAPRASIWPSLLVGAAIGASTWMRSIAILVVPAIACARAYAHWREGGRGWLRFALLRVLPIVAAAWLVKLPWDLHVAANPPAVPVEQNFLHSYSTAMWRVDGGDPSSPHRSAEEILARIPVRLAQVTSLLGSGMLESTGGFAPKALGALVLVLVGLVAWRRRAAPELFALGATAVICVYFGFRDRLMLPVWLLMLPAAFEGLILVLGRLGSTTAHGAALLVLLAWNGSAMDPRGHRDDARAQHELHARWAADVRELVPPEARLAAPIGWHASVHLGRPVWSLFFVARRAGNDFEAAERVYDKHAIDHVVLWPRVPADRAWIEVLTRKYGPPARRGEALAWRVRRFDDRPKAAPPAGR